MNERAPVVDGCLDVESTRCWLCASDATRAIEIRKWMGRGARTGLTTKGEKT